MCQILDYHIYMISPPNILYSSLFIPSKHVHCVYWDTFLIITKFSVVWKNISDFTAIFVMIPGYFQARVHSSNVFGPLRACLHEGRVTLVGWLPQPAGQKKAGVYMRQGNPTTRAIRQGNPIFVWSLSRSFRKIAPKHKVFVVICVIIYSLYLNVVGSYFLLYCTRESSSNNQQ